MVSLFYQSLLPSTLGVEIKLFVANSKKWVLLVTNWWIYAKFSATYFIIFTEYNKIKL